MDILPPQSTVNCLPVSGNNSLITGYKWKCASKKTLYFIYSLSLFECVVCSSLSVPPVSASDA